MIKSVFKSLICSLFFGLICSCSKTIEQNRDIEYSFDSSRFSIQVLATGMIDPTEIAVADNGDVVVLERKGKVNYYSSADKKITSAGNIKVNLGHEDGLLGIALDPNFQLNRHVYICYTPDPHREQRLSRFKISNQNKLDIASEKVLLSFPIVPERHQGGSVAFDKYGNLYLSTGENTKPTDINGHAPIDERDGHEINDSQRSAANTNDLRGKILRIHPMSDGTYQIPKGNLFPVGTPNTRPEIFIMGCRNPFRIALDPTNATLFWGDIGPDAGDDSEKGPMGYDEINKTNKAGNFGWPYFIADNKAYADVDYSTNTILNKFDANMPINNSPNNTGMRRLPPAQAAWVWYPYSASKEFPIMGLGGRTAIAGAVYQYNKSNKTGFPKWFDKKLIVADWMRNQMKAIAQNDKSKADSIFNFLPHINFKRPIDMQFGSDGCLYVLEYGSNWFDNTDARLIKISYLRGNLAPKPIIKADKLAGGIPLKVKFDASQTKDADNDKIIYEWRFDNGKIIQSNEQNPEYTFQKAGIYNVSLTATDSKGNASSRHIEIIAGNTPSQVNIDLPNHGTFFWGGDNIPYSIQVQDKEDGIINSQRLNIKYGAFSTASSIAQPYGEKLMAESDCKSCHRTSGKSVGPSLEQIANTYHGTDDAQIHQLALKIIQGGSGKWGNYVMSAHPQLVIEEAKEMVKYICTLASTQTSESIAPQGEVMVPALPLNPKIGYGFTVSGFDNGLNGKLSLPFNASKILRPAILPAKDYDWCKDIINSGEYARMPFPSSAIGFNNIDLKNVASITLVYNYDFYYPNCLVNCTIDKPNGKIIGSIELVKKTDESKDMFITLPLNIVEGTHNIYFTYHPDLKIHAPLNLKTIIFNKAVPNN